MWWRWGWLTDRSGVAVDGEIWVAEMMIHEKALEEAVTGEWARG